MALLCNREHLYRCAKYPQPPSPPSLPKKASHMSISTQKFTLSTYKCTMKPKNKPTTHFLKYLKFRQSWTNVLGTVRAQLQFYALHKFCRKKQCCLFTNPCPLPPPHPIQCWKIKGIVPWRFQHCLWGGGSGHGRTVLVARGYNFACVKKRSNKKLTVQLSQDFVHDCRSAPVVVQIYPWFKNYLLCFE